MTKPLVDLSDFDVWLGEWRDAYRAGGAGSGRFSRVPHGPLDGKACADFAIIDYTLGPWPLPPSEVDLRVEVLQQYQSTKTGLFDPTARPATTPMSAFDGADARRAQADGEDMDAVQATAYFFGALELLGARPLQPLRALDSARTPPGIEKLLASLDWAKADRESARAAGVASCLATAGDVGPEWFSRYLAWLDREVDPKTGLWRKNVATEPARALRGAYQQYVIYDRFRAALPDPDHALKSAMALQNGTGLFDGDGPGWTDVAAVYVIDRSFRQCGKTFARVRACLGALARAVEDKVHDATFRQTITPYRMAGLVSLLAVLASALPGSVKYGRPLRFFADRRLFV